MSSALVQVKLKDASNRVRYNYSDPENLIDRIDMIHSIEICYRRGLITWIQFKTLELWLEDGFIHDSYGLAAGLQAISAVSGYEDEPYAEMLEQTIGGMSLQEIKNKLQVLSDEFTCSLDYKAEDYKEI